MGLKYVGVTNIWFHKTVYHTPRKKNTYSHYHRITIVKPRKQQSGSAVINLFDYFQFIINCIYFIFSA